MACGHFRWTALVPLLIGLLSAQGEGRDLAGIKWKDFKDKSELVFEGMLVKAEMIEHNPELSFTYVVWKTFKGPELKEVSFKTNLRENVNKEVGRIAIIALRREGDKWVLSVDERSCWRHENLIGKDGPYPVFEIPESLLYGFPQELSERVELKVQCGTQHHFEKLKVFPTKNVDAHLKTILEKSGP